MVRPGWIQETVPSDLVMVQDDEDSVQAGDKQELVREMVGQLS